MTEKLTIPFLFNAPVERVWQGLTDPALVKQYFFGTNLISTWQKGSPILFRGEWQGKTYEDKGTILSIEAPRHLSYNYWSSMSGEPDLPENYMTLTFDLSVKDGATELILTQETTPEKKEHSASNWKMVMDGLKKLIEKA